MKEIEFLRNELSKIRFLKGIMEMPKSRIDGTSFYPCGTGVYNNSLAEKSIMVLGQDQDNETGFSKSCFFTNCLMGIRMNSARNVGKSPGFLDEQFLIDNLNYLKRQIEILRPTSIIVLGLIPLKFLSLLSIELRLKTTFLDSFREIDCNEYGYLKNVKFEEIGQIDIALLVHPSYRKRNCLNRKFHGMKGNEAEVEILKRMITNIDDVIVD